MQIVQAIVYKLKTGCKWAYVPVKEFVTERDYSWQSIYYHYSKWSKDESWHKAWTGVFVKPKDIPGLSSVQLDGSHTPAEKGGEAIGYQGRKKCETTNLTSLSDSLGNMLAFSEAYSGEHHGLYRITDSLQAMLE